MIKWVEIKDWESDGKEPFLILIRDNGKLIVEQYVGSFSLETTNWHYYNRKVTHAAKINFPVEKTLEEKFEEVCDKYMVSINRPLEMEGEPFVALLAEVAKQHYEEKK